MSNLISHEGNTNQNNTVIPSHPSQNGYHQDNKQQQMLVKMQTKGTLTHCWWEGKVEQPLQKSIWRLLTDIKLELPCNPATALGHIHPKECKSAHERYLLPS
jgi:hypothetical protein